MFIFWIAIIVIVAVLIWKALERKGYGESRTGSADTARDRNDSLRILEERFARGEITREEFLGMKDVLDDRKG
ncbi:MAG: SHOCT domain-containing protein [Desulfatibacillaceae bacterium]